MGCEAALANGARALWHALQIIEVRLQPHQALGTWFASDPRSIPEPKESEMANEKPASGARKTIGDIAPKLAEITEDILFGDVWERPQLSKRDRSLVTCAALVATGKTEQMNFHLPRAIENGVTMEELVEMITHLAFYAGWPNAMSAVAKAKELFGAKRS
jgi:4-carboxymuconolactone decarboxylase